MAVAYVSDTDSGPAIGTSIVWAGFAVSGANPVIVLAIALSGSASAETVTSVVCSAGLTSGTPVEVNRLQANSGTIVSIWKIPAPVGTGTITANLSASMAHQACALLLQGADQTDPCPIADATNASGVSPDPLTVTPANLTANDAVVACGANALAGDNPRFNNPSYTGEIYHDNTSDVNIAVGYHLGTGAVAVKWEGGPHAASALVGVRVKAVTVGGDVALAMPAGSLAATASAHVNRLVNSGQIVIQKA
jgi:hypothetical protein